MNYVMFTPNADCITCIYSLYKFAYPNIIYLNFCFQAPHLPIVVIPAALLRLRCVGRRGSVRLFLPYWNELSFKCVKEMGHNGGRNGAEVGEKWTESWGEIGRKWGRKGPKVGEKWAESGGERGRKWGRNRPKVGEK